MTRLQAASPARRNLLIATGVVALHAALLWALQNGLQIRASQMLVPVELLSELLDTPARPPAPPRPKPAPLLAAAPQPLTAAALPPLMAAALPSLAVASPVPPAAEASLIATGKATPAQEAAPAPVAAARTAAPPDSPATVQLPSINANYLHNPKPPYPPISARLGEAGRTVYKVWIGVDGKAQRAELVSSSGFARLDKAAHETVMGWRYVPGQRGGVAEPMAFNVPILWELSN
jgi:protein TonB